MLIPPSDPGSSRRTSGAKKNSRVSPVPRRKVADPLARRVGDRIRSLRKAAGLTGEKLAFESELGSKGHLSDIENGLARPTIRTLKVLADRLGVVLLDLVT